MTRFGPNWPPEQPVLGHHAERICNSASSCFGDGHRTHLHLGLKTRRGGRRICRLPVTCGGEIDLGTETRFYRDIYERVRFVEKKRFSYYLGIDQHARQITISLRNEDGDVLLARQVSTQPAKINAFFQQLTRERLRNDEQFVAVLEVCGFNDWLIRMLYDYRCHKVILIQPDDRKKRKTDRRDAAALSELLWVNRGRFLQGKPIRGLRQVDIASTTDQENRRLTTLRKNAGRARTRIVNKVKQILRRHNLQWEMPTKRFPTLAAIAWLKKLVLPEIDRLEMDHLLADLKQVQQRLEDLEK